MRTQDYIAIEHRYSAGNYMPLDVVLERGEGIWLYDVEGRRYMDFLAAYSAANQGHSHPRLVAALQQQAQRLALPSRAFRNDQLPLLARELCELTGYDMMLPMNTGAEAVETAIKAARKWGYTVKGIPEDQAEIVVCGDNFHGRTTTIVSFSSEPQYRECFGPCTPGFVTVPYGDSDALEDAITDHTAAFLVEPIQGEAGVVLPPAGYLAKAREICTRRHVLLIADEIQSGLGRTGKLLASEHEGVHPDAVCLGKALSGGLYPVSAVVADRQVLGVFRPGDHGSTYGGNPLGCAVAREALRVLVEERLIEQSAVLGDHMLQAVKRIHSRHIAQVRGKGLWVGIVLDPAAGGARRYTEALMERGLLCKETHDNVIRLSPPLVITREQIDWAVEQIAAVLSA
ncbi:MAG: ornithine--oxo-acid transaminase [Anaerolineae bacterium]